MSILDKNFDEELDSRLEKIAEHNTIIDKLTLEVWRIINSHPRPIEVMFNVDVYRRDMDQDEWVKWTTYRKKLAFSSWQSMSDVGITLSSNFEVRTLYPPWFWHKPISTDKNYILVDIPKIEYTI